MTGRRRLMAVSAGAFVIVVIALSLVPWTWHGLYETPAGQPVRTVVFRCGAAFGADSVRGPAKLAYNVEGVPCGERHAYRLMTAVDVTLGVIVLVLIVGWGRGRFAERVT